MSESADMPECLGAMFPCLADLQYNEPCSGKVFSVRIDSLGIGTRHREVSIDREQWQACRACPEYRSCYDLSVARMLLEQDIEDL